MKRAYTLPETREGIGEFMNPLIGYIVSVITGITVGLLLQRFADKPNLQYFLPGTFVFEIKDPDVGLRTDSLTLQNPGKKPATNIEIVKKKGLIIFSSHRR